MTPRLGRVKADPGQIEQVIMNLAVNARDAMPSGGNLTIETRNVELDEAYARSHATVKPGPHVMLAVRDTGVGMTPETKARIFEPFFTTKEAGQGDGPGTGHRVRDCQTIGRQYLGVQRTGPGHASSKYILPIVSESPAVAEQAKPETDSSLGNGNHPGGRRRRRGALADSPRRWNRLDTKSWKRQDAESALATCANYDGPIHLLLTDVVMPQMSGPVVAEKVTALRPDIKVLYMSGYTDDAIVHHGVLSQEMPFIQKPFSPLALRKKIREVLG